MQKIVLARAPPFWEQLFDCLVAEGWGDVMVLNAPEQLVPVQVTAYTSLASTQWN